MAFDLVKYYKLVRPKSETDSAYESYEFLLKWYDRKGGLHNRLFTDREARIKVKSSQINAEDSETMENIIRSEDRTIILIAENYSKNDMAALLSIFTARIIERIYKDNTKERIGLVDNSFKYREVGGKYNIQFNIMLYNRALPK